MARSDLGARVAVAVVGIPVVLGAIWLGGWALGLLIAGAAAVAAREFYHLAEARGVRPFTGAGTLACVAVVLLATSRPTPLEAGALASAAVLLVFLLSLGASVWLRWPGGEPMAAVAVTTAGVVYVGFTLAFVPLLRALPSPGFLLLPLLTTWAGDSAAYFVGRKWGRRKLAPMASPKKSVEGALAGLAGSALAAALVSVFALADLPTDAVGPWAAAGIGLVLGAAAQVGDLAESVLKREAGVKDSGRLLPGHGGMLDRVDALLPAFPLAWALFLAAGALS